MTGAELHQRLKSLMARVGSANDRDGLRSDGLRRRHVKRSGRARNPGTYWRLLLKDQFLTNRRRSRSQANSPDPAKRLRSGWASGSSSSYGTHPGPYGFRFEKRPNSIASSTPGQTPDHGSRYARRSDGEQSHERDWPPQWPHRSTSQDGLCGRPGATPQSGQSRSAGFL